MKNRWIPIVAVLVIATASSMALAEPVMLANQGVETTQQQNMFQNRLSAFMGWLTQWAYGPGPGIGPGPCNQDCQGTGDCDCDGVGDQDQLRQRDRIRTPGTPQDGDGNAYGRRNGDGTGTCNFIIG